MLGAARNQGNCMADAGEMHRESRAPSARPKDREVHQDGLAAEVAVDREKTERGCPAGTAPGNHLRNAGTFSPAMICSKVSRALTSSNELPLTNTSAAIERVL